MLGKVLDCLGFLNYKDVVYTVKKRTASRISSYPIIARMYYLKSSQLEAIKKTFKRHIYVAYLIVGKL